MSGTDVVTYERTVVPNVVVYQEQQREQSLARRYTPQQRTQLAEREQAAHIERITDKDGMISYHAFPAMFASGYSLPAMPAGTRVIASEMYKNLSVFRAVGLDQGTVNNLVLEYARQWAT